MVRHSDPAVIVALLSGAIALAISIVSGIVPEVLKHVEDTSEQHLTYTKQTAALSLCVEEFLESLGKLECAARTEGQYPPAIADPALMYDDDSMKKFAWFDRFETKNYRYQYALVSTVYRLSALLGWMEVYRRDINYLRGTDQEQQAIAGDWQKIRNELSNLTYGKDTCILPDEQRAIGEVMISLPPSEAASTALSAPRVIGYADFSKRMVGLPIYGLETRGKPTTQPVPNDYQRFQEFWIFYGTMDFIAGRIRDDQQGKPQRPSMDLNVRTDRLDHLVTDLKQLDHDLQVRKG